MLYTEIVHLGIVYHNYYFIGNIFIKMKYSLKYLVFQFRIF